MLVVTTSLEAQRETNSRDRAFSIDGDDPIVLVSDTLYREILMWLKGEGQVSIIDFLAQTEISGVQVSRFLNRLGLQQQVQSKGKVLSGQSSECQCSSIMPHGIFDKKTSDVSLDTFTQSHWGFLGGQFWHKWVTYNNDGLGFAIDVKVESNAAKNKSYDVTLSQEGSSTVRITNLCTDGLGYRNDLCNCDKDIIYNGGYANKITTASDFATNKNSGMRLALGNGYYVYSGEVNLAGTGTAAFDTIDQGVWAFSLEQGTEINFSTIGNALTHLANYAFQDTNIATRYGYIGSFISTLDTIRHINDTNSNFNYSHVRDFTGALKLRANVPRIFKAFATINTLNETEGKKKNLSETYFRSIFNWNFYIPSTKASYTFAGIQNPDPSEACCSENVGLWEFHGKTFDTDMNFVGQQFKVWAENLFNYDLMGAPILWSQSRLSSDPNLLQGGYINLQGNPAMQFPEGHLYTVDRCNCESFLVQDTNHFTGVVGLDFMDVKLTFPPAELCPDETAQLYINNSNQLLEPCQVMEIRLNNQLIFSGITNNFTISATGNYEVSYVDTCTGCRVSKSFTVSRCSTGSEDADCIRDHFSIFPNPVFVDNPELMMQACLSSCADTVSMAAVNNWASNFFPASITIRDMSGSIFYGPTTHFSPVTVGSDFCLQDLIPSSAVSSWSNYINTNAILTVQLLSGDSFSKIIQIK